MLAVVSSIRKFKTLWPLPGGAGHYVQTLRYILQLASESDDLDQLLEVLSERYKLVSYKAARSYTNVAKTLGFIDIEGRLVHLTPAGHGALAGQLQDLLGPALMERVSACHEVIEILRVRPHRIGRLRKLLAEEGFDWGTDAQLRYRLRWLEEAGIVSRIGQAAPMYGVNSGNESVLG